jgi:hypothetical protein
MIYLCCEQNRRDALIGKPLNGLDYLEVLDHAAPTEARRQRTLLVHFVNDLAPRSLSVNNVVIQGGERIRNIKVLSVAVSGKSRNILEVTVDQPGDFSTYTLCLVAQPPDLAPDLRPPAGFDPMLSAIEFSFKVECHTDFDCRTNCDCPPVQFDEPAIDYLAKDYGSFRRLLLDRLAALMPAWTERHVPDIGIALVELLAYVGDYLSYQQDATATEAYLGTARRRVSIRRHARLVDYLMHDGCNSRAWLVIEAGAPDGTVLPGPTANSPGTLFTTDFVAPPGPLTMDAVSQAQDQGAVFFETMYDTALWVAHNEINLYTWGDAECCLPAGATRATLLGNFPKLAPGNILMFEEVIGPETGSSDDADPSRRHPVRLTAVKCLDDDGKVLTDPLNGQQITEIEWACADALPFPFCLSVTLQTETEITSIPNVSVAHGNVVLVDHGLTIPDEKLPAVPKPNPVLKRVPAQPAGCRCGDGMTADAAGADPLQIPPRYRPSLTQPLLTFAAPIKGAGSTAATGSPPPAAEMLNSTPAGAMPQIVLIDQTNTWTPRRDLLASAADATDFVVETESDGTAYLRFGDGNYGRRPDEQNLFTARYRVGNGVAGNVGLETIIRVVSDNPDLKAIVSKVRNPLAAAGGVEPEAVEDVRQKAPQAFRVQERAVTEADYAEITGRGDPGIQKAAAQFRWTGSWHTVFLSVDRIGGALVDDAYKKLIRQRVEPFRMAGYDLEVETPDYVSLEIEMTVCVKRDYFRADVKAVLLDVFSNRILPNGARGIFYPDNFTFGQTVYLSPFYATAQAVDGIASVVFTTFQRQQKPDSKPLADGKVCLGPMEIARCDNDPDYPEHGVIRITIGGGR